MRKRQGGRDRRHQGSSCVLVGSRMQRGHLHEADIQHELVGAQWGGRG